MQPIKIITIKRAISKIKYIGDGKICVIDEENSVRTYDITTFKIMDGFRIRYPKNNPFENSVDVSSKGKYVAISIRGKHKVSIWSLKEKKLLFTLGWHKGDILSVEFDKEEKYLISGGEDGRSYIWSMTTGKMISTLPPHADYIMSCSFSKNSLWAATGSYDKSITITNISSMELSFRKKSHKGAVVLLKFMNNQRLISGDKIGELVVWDYTKAKVLHRLTNMNDRVIDICYTTNESFMFAICDSNKKVSIYNMETYELISDEFIKLLEQPSSIEYIAETNSLVVGTIDGSIYFYDLLKDENKLKEFISNNDLASAYELIRKNPFLEQTPTYKSLEERWNKSLLLAQKKFEEGETEIAKQILSPYLKVPIKRAIVQSMFNDFSEFEKFKQAVLNKKFTVAYSLANKYPYLKSTIYYKKMEDEWKRVFNKAKELILVKGKEDEVKELLKPFRGVTNKTPFIQSLFNEKQLYTLLVQKLAKKDFQDFFALVNRHPFLSDSEEYKKAINYSENLLKQAKQLLKKGDFIKVLSIAEELEHFPQMKEEAEELKEKANILLIFQRVLATNDLNKIEKLVKEHPFLEEVKDYKNIEKIWQEKFQKAEVYSANGDVENILNELKEYLQVKDKTIKIGQLIKSAYLYQLLSLLVKQAKGKNVSDLIKKGIKNYIKLFGFDIEVGDIIEKAKQLKIDIDLSNVKEGDLITWHHYNVPKKIWEDFE